MKIITLTIAATLALTQFNVNASNRWFDIEVIAFERPHSDKVTEDFKLEQAPIDTSKSYDIISEYLISECKRLEQETLQAQTQADILSQEQQPPVAVSAANIESTPEFSTSIEPEPEAIDEKPSCENINARAEIPFDLNAPEQIHQDFRYLLSQSQLQLTDAVQRLRRQGLKPIVHLGWRQEETSKRNAIAQRLFGGKNYSQQYSLNGEPVMQAQPVFGSQIDPGSTPQSASEENLTANVENYNQFIETILESDNAEAVIDTEQNTELESVWQLDGLFTVYIRNNYLNIETQLNLRSEDVENNVLNTVYFDQFKRVISGEIHYFDHPKMGLIVQIRRYAH